MQVGAAIGTITHSRVAVRDELVVVGAERRPGLICRLVQADDHESAHKEGRVTLLVVIQAGVVIDFVVLILLVVHEFFELFAEQVDLTQVKWAKIRKKWLVNQVVVNAEVEGVLAGFGRVLVADPVEAAWDDLDWLIRVSVALASPSSLCRCLCHICSFYCFFTEQRDNIRRCAFDNYKFYIN